MKTVAACVLAALALMGAGCGESKKITVSCPGGYAVGSRPTLVHPLVCAHRTTLAAASAGLGVPVTLPNSALVKPSDAGSAWTSPLDKQSVEKTVAVTFPSQRVIVQYTRPAPSNGSAAHFQAMAKGINDAQVVRLGGRVPALTVKQNSDQTHANFATIIFNVGLTEIRVMGHYRRDALQRVAQSILEASNS
jgi:hypothetical protein